MGELLKNFSFDKKQTLISIVAPVFNEMQVIKTFHLALTEVLNQHQFHYEIIYVDDGSNDQSFAVLQSLYQVDKRLSLIRLSRNFGKEIAVTAGLEAANGDAVIVIDSDLQDPPELIPEMIKAWQLGADVVNMRRSDRQADSFIKRITAKYFYKVIGHLSDIPIQQDVGDYRLLSRRAVNAINLMPEKVRFMKGIFAWVGFQSITLDYQRQHRVAGKTKWSYWKLWNFALDGITSFSTAPLKISLYLGALITCICFIATAYLVGTSLMQDTPTSNIPWLMLTMLFLGGIHLISLGIIGEYLARMSVESKSRPLYLIDQKFPSESASVNNYLRLGRENSKQHKSQYYV